MSQRYAGSLSDIVARYLSPTPDHPGHPSYAGAVVLSCVDGAVALDAVGYALRYAPGPVVLARHERASMRTDSIFDLASITKVFTAVLALRRVEAGDVDLDAPVSVYLKGFADQAVTARMLLAHTSGLPAMVNLPALPADQRRDAVLRIPLESLPGTVFRYSDVGMLVLGRLLEEVTSTSLDELLTAELSVPLRLRDLGYRMTSVHRGRSDVDDRLVATEAKPGRGLVRGVVHDENAYSLGGVAGHAGVFGTAHDVAVLGRMIAGGGEYGGVRVLAESTVRDMLVDANPGLPAIDPENRPGRAAHGLGVDLNQPWYMGRLASTVTWGHTGFTGTSLVVDQVRRVVLVLLTNRVHPDRDRGGCNEARVAVADAVADAADDRAGDRAGAGAAVYGQVSVSRSSRGSPPGRRPLPAGDL